MVLKPKFQFGPVLFDGKRWQNPGARRIAFGLFNSDALGNPVVEAAEDVQAFTRFLQKRAPGETGLPQLGHFISSGLPQFSQNFASLGFSNEQCGHSIAMS